ncbi:MAG TPA: LON peptidase substrate-binding domain-containing protein [Vicinamibacteria bacterium]|nr:LON peptidase substrate-binding domain-containing protein [Vicinamibacteria bacterium]
MSQTRRVPIFPLPETVLFPSVALPLHLFEPRYLQMAEDVLEGDELVVIVLLRPGWQEDYYGSPPVHEIATLGKVTSHRRLPDGRFHIILEGLERVRLHPGEGDERLAGKLYRVRAISGAPESRVPAGVSTAEISTRLRSLFRELEESTGKARGTMPGDELGFEALVNRISSLVDVPPAVKQRLLEQDDLRARAAALEGHVEEALGFWRTLARFRTHQPRDPSHN